MNIYRKIVIFIIFLLFTYILFRLLTQRILIRKEVEGFTVTDSRVISIQKGNAIIPNMNHISPKYYPKKIGGMYIKSAYAGGYDGANISSDMLLYTLSLGYRYMVIHVFYDSVTDPDNNSPTTPPKTAVVGFSPTFSPMFNTAIKTMSLVDFVTLIQTNAFSQTSPNYKDPFFLHILPAYQETIQPDASSDLLEKQQSTVGFNTQLNTQIEQVLMSLQDSNRLSGPVTKNSTLRELVGKFVIAMDTDSIQGNMTNNLKNCITLEVPRSDLMLVKKLKKSKAPWNVVLPHDEDGKFMSSIPDYINLYRTYNMNCSPVCVWESRYIGVSALGTSNLGDYEKLFADEGGTAFIIRGA